MPSQSESSSWPVSANSHQFKPKLPSNESKEQPQAFVDSKATFPSITKLSTVQSVGLVSHSSTLPIYPRYLGCQLNDKLLNGATVNTNEPKSAKSLRDRIAHFREKVRVEDLALSSGVQDDHKKLKDHVGGWAFSPEQMQHLKVTPYEYNASAGSYLELFVMQRFWIWLSTFIPMSIAPCTITAVGFLINLVTCSILITYSPDAKSEVPRWSLLLCALGVFLYQIMDALDGKQCYKVQNTQIEEFYDHGCDAVSTILLMYSTAIATQCGQWPALTLTVVFGSLIAFYSTHWQCYVTDQMVFGKIDVTEAQWSMITIHVLSAVFGQSIWSTKLVLMSGSIELSLTQALALLSLSSLASAILANASIVLLGTKTPLDKAGIQIPRRNSASHRIKPLIPVTILTLLTIVSYKLGYYHLNCMMYVLMFGFTYAKLTMKLVIAHCTQSELDLSEPALAVAILFVVNAMSPLIAPNKALLGALICNAIELIRYFTCVSWDLRVALEVYIFSIRYPPGHAKNRSDSRGYYINGLNNKEVLERK